MESLLDIAENFDIVRVNSEPASTTVFRTLNNQVDSVSERTRDVIVPETGDSGHNNDIPKQNPQTKSTNGQK